MIRILSFVILASRRPKAKLWWALGNPWLPHPCCSCKLEQECTRDLRTVPKLFLCKKKWSERGWVDSERREERGGEKVNDEWERGCGGGLWATSYGMCAWDCEQEKRRTPWLKKDKLLHFMMIFRHHCHLLAHLLLHPLFLLVLLSFARVMKATGSTVACIIWSKSASQHRCTTQPEWTLAAPVKKKFLVWSWLSLLLQLKDLKEISRAGRWVI